MEGYGWLSVRCLLSALINDNDDGGRSCDARAVRAIPAYRFFVFRSIRSDCSANPFDSFQWKVRARSSAIPIRNRRKEFCSRRADRRNVLGHELTENLADFQRSRTTRNGSLGVKRPTINSLVASKRLSRYIGPCRHRHSFPGSFI